MELVVRIPAGNVIIGTKEVVKGIRNGNVRRVIVAKNCPEFLMQRIEGAGKVLVEMFDGNQRELAVRIGKPFPIAVAGFEK